MGHVPNKPVEWTLEDIRFWAGRLKVSQQALALRLEKLGYAPAGFMRRIRAQQPKVIHGEREGTGGNYNSTQVNELGDRFTLSVLHAERRAAIKTFEAAEIIAIKPQYFAGIQQQIETQKQESHADRPN